MSHVERVLELFHSALEDDSAAKAPRRRSFEALVDKYAHSPAQPSDSLANSLAAVRPWNYQDFIDRMQSFRAVGAWFAKPQSIDAVECCRFGWVNSGVDSLRCSSCEAALTHDKEDSSGARLLQQLKSGHGEGCCWANNPSPESFRFLQLLSLDDERAALLQRTASILEHCAESVEQAVLLQLPNELAVIFGSSSSVTLLDRNVNEDVKVAAKSIAKALRNASSDKDKKACWFKRGAHSLVKESIVTQVCNTSLEPYLIGALCLATCGWTAAAPAGRLVDLACVSCAREISLVSFRSRPLDPASQHRLYCPWLAEIECRAGWRMLADRILVDSSCLGDKRLKTDESPEQAFKRIRAALKDAVSAPKHEMTSAIL